ncbi:hypothetical protein R4Z09_11760 [Niallia oryzisoli]|uniref:Uncharacterized protein n=1 Tax=Niallia oryzisoli TaxID=1737571 RepID=A0ABZ2CIN1_9BACI
MFLEEEVYGMLNWGFGSVMLVQLLFVIRLWMRQKFDTGSFIYVLIHIILFSFAGYNLLIAINTFDYETGMDSEEASVSIAIAGILWALSVFFLLKGGSRLVKTKK